MAEADQTTGQPEGQLSDSPQNPPTEWVFTPEAKNPQTDPGTAGPASVDDRLAANRTSTGGSVSWSASEYIAHQRGANWFLLLGLGTAAIAGLVYITTRDVLSPILIMVAVLIFAIFTNRTPKVLEYEISNSGVRVGPKTYGYDLFKAFTIVVDSAIPSINLHPMKRFMPSLTVYFSPEDGERIVDALSAYLPHQEGDNDILDRAVRKLRF